MSLVFGGGVGHDGFRDSMNMFDLKFVCGTNLLEKNMKKRKNSWNIHRLDTLYFNDVVLVGVGTDGLSKVENHYTEKLYKSMLSSKYAHSVRDERTKRFLESIGIDSINTGCSTLWQLTPEHCASIPSVKSDTVLFTLTDYCQDVVADSRLLDILCSNYRNVYFWPQGIFDSGYFEKLKGNRNIKMLNPSLQAYDAFLCSNDCDYIGTRLHAGIKAMQRKRRSIIIGVDNRARDMNETYNLNLIERSDISKLEERINGEITTRINVDYDAIKKFLIQFKETAK